MARQTALVKISGDLCQREDVLEWIRKLSAEYFTVILVGGGTQINEAFEKAGFKVGKHGPLGRETESFKESQLARDVLEENQERMQDLLASRGVMATVVIPVLEFFAISMEIFLCLLLILVLIKFLF